MALAAATRRLGSAVGGFQGDQVGELLGDLDQELVVDLRGLQGAGRRLAGGAEARHGGAVGGDVAHHGRLRLQGVLQARDRVLPALLRLGDHLLFAQVEVDRPVAGGEGLVDAGDRVGDALGLGEELLGALDLAGDGRDQRIRQARQVLGLVDQGLCLVLDLLDLVIDLLQFARGGQHVLDVVLRIEHDPLRLGRNGDWRAPAAPRRRRARCAKTTAVHREVSCWRGEHVGRPIQALAAQPGGGEPAAAMRGDDLGDGGLVGLGRGGGEGERDLGEAELEQAIAAAGLAVVVALRRRSAQDLDLPVIESEAPIDRGDLRLERALVRQEDAGRAALDDGRRDGAAVDVRERLRGEDDRGVLLPQRLQPLAQLPGEAGVVERQPALVDDEQGGAAVEAILDAMEQVGEDGGRSAGPDQAFGLEGLDFGFAKALAFRIEQPAPRSRHRVGLQRLLQRVRLQQHGKAGHGALRQRARTRARSAPTIGAPSGPA